MHGMRRGGIIVAARAAAARGAARGRGAACPPLRALGQPSGGAFGAGQLPEGTDRRIGQAPAGTDCAITPPCDDPSGRVHSARQARTLGLSTAQETAQTARSECALHCPWPGRMRGLMRGGPRARRACLWRGLLRPPPPPPAAQAGQGRRRARPARPDGMQARTGHTGPRRPAPDPPPCACPL